MDPFRSNRVETLAREIGIAFSGRAGRTFAAILIDPSSREGVRVQKHHALYETEVKTSERQYRIMVSCLLTYLLSTNGDFNSSQVSYRSKRIISFP